MKYRGTDGKVLYVDCEVCDHTLEIPTDICNHEGNNNYSTSKTIKCDRCGNESDKIIPVKKSFWQKLKDQSHNAKVHKQQRAEADEPIRCPKCGSTQITANKKGFGLGKAVAGDLVAGPVAGLVTGSMGKNKVMITCLKCGHKWKAGKSK